MHSKNRKRTRERELAYKPSQLHVLLAKLQHSLYSSKKERKKKEGNASSKWWERGKG
jgi:hypothetical protein